MIPDPRLIIQDDLPLIVFSDRAFGLIAFLIKWKTAGDYNHVMLALRPGKLVAQTNFYAEVLMEVYMQKSCRLKFVSLKNLTPIAKNMLYESVARRLKAPWWTRGYDWLGVFGQAIGVKWIQTPGLEYCSEDVIFHLKSIMNEMPEFDRMVINSIPKQASPQELNEFVKRYPEVFTVYGKWEADDNYVNVPFFRSPKPVLNT